MEETTTLTPKEFKRFWKKIHKTETCWNWTANKAWAGYGTVGFRGKVVRAHRLSYMIHKGEIPEGIGVLHTCDNPACCNPDHLWIGTQKDNAEDMMRKGRKNPVKGDAHYSRTNPEKLARKSSYGPKRQLIQQGKKHWSVKLTEDQVAEIRTTIEPIKEVCLRLGISKSTFNRIKYRRSWKNTP